MLDGPELMELIERLGGWGVVVWIVISLNKRSDKAVDSLTSAVNEFSKFRMDEVGHNERLEALQREVLVVNNDTRDAVRELAAKGRVN